jgi:hypothetical protein
MLHSTRFLLVTFLLFTLLLGARTARAQERYDAPAAPKSTGTALLLAGGLTLGGMWAGNAVYGTQADADGNVDQNAIAHTGMGLALGSLLWGTSAGHAYAGNTRYALLSGAGKSLLLGATAAGERWLGAEGDHPYLMVMGLAAIMVWDIYDVAVLPRAVAEHNVRARLQAMPAVTPVQGGWAASMTWQF